MCSCNRFQNIRVGLAAIVAFISLNHRDRRRPDMYTIVPGDQWWRHLLISMGLATSDDVAVFLYVLGLLLCLWLRLIKAIIAAKPTLIFWKRLQEHIMQNIFFDFVEPFLDQDNHGMAIFFWKAALLSLPCYNFGDWLQSWPRLQTDHVVSSPSL